MIGAQGLEKTPETMTDMDSQNSHDQGIDHDIKGVVKCHGNYLEDVGVGFIDKMELSQMENDKQQDNQTGIRHGRRADGTSPGPDIHDITG